MKKYILIITIIISVIFINISISPPDNKTKKIISTSDNYLCNFYTRYQDKEPPVIILNGIDEVYVNKGSAYNDPGVKVLDNCDGNLTNNVTIKGKVNTNKEGLYKIKYEVKDKNNNINEIERNIHVKKTDNDIGTIYLTFDDGPSKTITSKVLDILKEEQIPATFFVINHDNSLNYLIKRASDEGHTIGLHSYTHDYSYIYSSIDNYFNDLNKIKEKVYSITGNYNNIIRFPGGSSNLVSRKYNTGIMTMLAEKVEQQGYKYYDWNIDSFDAGGVNSSDEVYNNVINNLSLNKVNMILLHDFENNYYTLDALPDIIKYAKEQGYIFKNITQDTRVIKHTINN